MKQLMRTSIYMLAMSVASVAAAPLMASPIAQQDRDHDNNQMQNQNHDRDNMQNHDRDRDHDNMQSRDESAYYNNRYYKQGWTDGQHHKRKNKHWKNDDDRRAYEAGLAHGERGEQWNKHQMRDNDHHDNDRH